MTELRVPLARADLVAHASYWLPCCPRLPLAFSSWLFLGSHPKETMLQSLLQDQLLGEPEPGPTPFIRYLQQNPRAREHVFVLEMQQKATSASTACFCVKAGYSLTL